MTYLGIDCDSHNMRFSVPEKRRLNYIAMLQNLLKETSVTYSTMEQMVGRLLSLECAVSAGMWYTRHQYAAMASSGVKPDSKKRLKNVTNSVGPRLRTNLE